MPKRDDEVLDVQVKGATTRRANASFTRRRAGETAEQNADREESVPLLQPCNAISLLMSYSFFVESIRKHIIRNDVRNTSDFRIPIALKYLGMLGPYQIPS
jgi:hypothetical protein